MEELIANLKTKYNSEIADIKSAGAAEISVVLKQATDDTMFVSDLKDHLVQIIDELTIVKINVVDTDGNLIDSFATNQ